MGSAQTKAQAQRFSLYNLSILMPRPTQRLDEAWGLKAEACHAPLLSMDLFSLVPDLFRVPYALPRKYAEMRLVAVRFDPIQEETRLVFQPLLLAEWGRGQKGFWGEDAAIHLFFKTTKTKILAWQVEMKKSYGNLNQQLLGVHPYFKKGNRATELDTVLCDLAQTGAYKLTFMNVRGARVLWSFGGFMIDRAADGTVSRGADVTIPNAEGIYKDEDDANMSVQRVSRFAGSLRAGLLPKPNRGDHLMEMFLTDAASTMPEPLKIRTIVDRIENPKLNTSQSVDCVSCHAAESARVWIEAHHKQGPTDQEYADTKLYGLDPSVSESARRNTANFRSFGYLDAEAVVSRRVLNETIEVQRFLENLP